MRSVARIEHIESWDDPRIEAYRNVRDADLVGRRGLFMAEGELVVRTLLDLTRAGARRRAQSVLLTPSRLARMEDAIEGLDDGSPVYVASQEVMDRVVGFPIHRGCLAAGERGGDRSVEQALDAGLASGPTLILEDLANHDNVGGVFRNAAALGARAVVCTRRCCDPLYRKAIRVSMGAALRVPFAVVENATDAIGALRARGFRTIALTPAPDAVDLIDLLSAGEWGAPDTALLLGAEGPGLSDEALRAADARARIDIERGTDSLNVAAASAIGLHALRIARRRAGRRDRG